MAVLVSAVLTQMKTIYLNDINGRVYSDFFGLPALNKVQRSLFLELGLVHYNPTQKRDVTLTITAGVTTITPAAISPWVLLSPLWIGERTPSSTDEFVEMKRVEVIPILSPAPATLQYWAWIENEVQFPAASVNREIRFVFKGDKADYAAVSDSLVDDRHQDYLAAKAAALLAITVGQNPSRAQVLNEIANYELELLKRVAAHAGQGVPKRARPYRSKGRRLGSWR